MTEGGVSFGFLQSRGCPPDYRPNGGSFDPLGLGDFVYWKKGSLEGSGSLSTEDPWLPGSPGNRG